MSLNQVYNSHIMGNYKPGTEGNVENYTFQRAQNITNISE